MDQTIHRECKVCGSKIKFIFKMPCRFLSDGFLFFWKCTRCRLLFAGEIISDAILDTAYGSLDQDTYYKTIGVTTNNKCLRALQDIGRLWNDIPIIDRSLLDVGCGYGHLLKVVRKFNPEVKIIGQEFPNTCADACRAEGFEVITSPLGSVSERFFIITLLDVAEHVQDPNKIFNESRNLLLDGGYIYIHTPRRCIFDSLFLCIARTPFLMKLANLWLNTRVSIYHLQLWTDEALRLSLERTGFKIIFFKREQELSWPLEEYVRMYLGERFRLPRWTQRIITKVIYFMLIRSGLLKNKAIVLAQKA